MFRTSYRCALSAAMLFGCIAPLSAAPQQLTDPSVGATPNLFNSVAMPVSKTPYDLKWQRAWPGGHGPVVNRAHHGAPLAALAQLANVQAGANHRVAVRADPLGTGGGGSSSTGRNSLARESADCEDYAIAKVKPLLALGFQPHNLYLVIGDDRNLMARRAILVVRTHGKFWVLDSLSSAVVDADLFRDFDPIVTLSMDRKWMHGYARGTRAQLAPPQRRPLIAPGPNLAAILLEQEVKVPGQPSALRASLARTNRCEARVLPRLEQLSMLGSK